MNKLFTLFNFFIMLFIIVMVFAAHLMFGHFQTSKFHFMLQIHYMPNYLPNWMLKYEKDLYGYYRVDKNYSGKWSAWYKSGAKEFETEYKDSKRIGKYTHWYESGTKLYEAEFKDGKEDGISMSWHKNGVKESEIEYKLDKKNGKATFWDASGKKIKEQEFKDDVMIKDYHAPVR